MRAREPFTLYKSKIGKKVIFYYIAYDEDGRRKKYCTGCTTKTQTMAVAMELYRTNSLIPKKQEIEKSLTLGEYAKHWWTKDCEYVKQRGRVLSEQYIDKNRRMLDKYILPTFKSALLPKINSNRIEAWQRFLLAKKHLAPKSANNILSIFSVMLEEVRTLANNSRQRGILSFEEAQDLLTNMSYWDNPLTYTASLLAACTGMRLGEIRALRPADLRDGYIHIEHSVDRHGVLKSTKKGDTRDLPLPKSLMETLENLAKISGKCDRIFSIAGVPMGPNTIRDSYYRALHKKGIKEEERVKRNLNFHSWRHFLNSQLLANGINESKTRKITGHSTAAMTEHYSHFLVNDFEDVLKITEDIIS